MIYDHEAIRRAFPEVTGIVDGGEIKLRDGTYVTIGKELDQNSIDIARQQINAELAATKYQRDRAAAYPSIQDQLDMQYWDNKNGTTTWVDAIAKVKTNYPKPL